ncbi:hypothetical protein MMC11_004705 [Xylographa trunciseda]|nr:hypothetical protein [Xylographa trunciseda]
MSIFATPPMSSGWYPAGGSFAPAYLEGCPENIGLGLDYDEVRRLKMEYRTTPKPQRSSSQYKPCTVFDQGPVSDVLVAKADLRPLVPYEPDSGYRHIKPELRTVTETSRKITAPESPMSKLDCIGIKDEEDNYGNDDDDEFAIAAMEQEDDLTGDDVPITAAERRAEKRKMKRFRLTHNQTRFLMSEFARQAHPDAAQRERLSRDIPGLTSRQVQVWFQNRRAKLKRFTSDDQERMMSTRALPEGFDMSQALHSPLEPHPYTNTPFQAPLTSPASLASTFHDGGTMRPFMADQLRQPLGHGGGISSTVARPAYHTFYTPPGSTTVSENVSPISSISERKDFNGHAFSPSVESRSTNPFITSGALAAAHFPHAQVPRFPFSENMPRTQAEFLSATQRANMSSVSNAMNYGEPATSSVGFHPQQVPQDYLTSYASDTAAPGQGSGFSYGPAATYQSPAISPRLPDLNSYIPGFETRSRPHSQLTSAGYPPSDTTQAFPNATRSLPQISSLPEPNIQYGSTALHNNYVGGYDRPENYYPRKRFSELEKNAEDVIHEEQVRRNTNFHP